VGLQRWNASIMLLVDAATEIIGVILFLAAAYLLLGGIRDRRLKVPARS